MAEKRGWNCRSAVGLQVSMKNYEDTLPQWKKKRAARFQIIREKDCERTGENYLPRRMKHIVAAERERGAETETDF